MVERRFWLSREAMEHASPFCNVTHFPQWSRKAMLDAKKVELGLIGLLVVAGMTIVGIAVTCSEFIWK